MTHPGKVGKAADGDLPLYVITADILNWFSGTRGIEEKKKKRSDINRGNYRHIKKSQHSEGESNILTGSLSPEKQGDKMTS